MTERNEDKLHDCGRAISDLERYTCKELLNSLQIIDKYVHQRGPIFSMDNILKEIGQRLARLDRLYTSVQSKLNIHQVKYFIHGYSVGSDYFSVHLELHISSGKGRKAAFKWNVSYLQGDIRDQMEAKWKALPEDATFFFKLRNVVRFYRQVSK